MVAYIKEETMAVIGVDVYNLTLTGEVSKCLNAVATDSDHIPCVIAFENDITIKIDDGGGVHIESKRA